MITQRYTRNILVNYIFTIFFYLDLTRGLWMIYLASRGFSLMQLGVLEGSFHVTSFLMEVPTGAVADLFGRKISRLTGRICYFISLLLLFSSLNFYLQLIGFIICALGYNLESGAGEALVYDSLVLTGRKENYMQIAGRMEFLCQISGMTAFLVGGYVALHSYPILFYISMGVSLAAFVTALFFTEPIIERQGTKQPAAASLFHDILASMRQQTVQSFRIILRQPRIAFLILFSELIFSFSTCLFFYLQNFWKDSGHNELYIGIVFAVNSIVSGVTGLNASAIEKKIGERGVLIFIPILLVVCLWGIAVTHWQSVFFILTGVLEGILIVAISDYINRLIPSSNRATILSFQSMTFSLFMIIMFPTFGWIGDTFSLIISFRAMALFVTLLCILYLILARSFFKPVHAASDTDKS